MGFSRKRWMIMNKTTKKILSVLFAMVLFMSAFPVVNASAATVANVGSLWDGFTSGSGTFTVTSDSRVYVAASSAPTGSLLQTAQLIQRELRAQFTSVSGAFDELVWGPADWAVTGDIVLSLDSSSGTGADGYKLNVTATTATVTAADTDGLIYGANNLMKCFRAVGGNSISGFSGNDSPDTVERTVSLDCGRKYLSAEWIKNFIRQMSWMGYNSLQLHFSDDGGFRVDLWDPEYFTSANGNDFSWLAGSAVQTWVYNGNKNNTSYPYRTDPDKGKYLTAAELVDICNVAKEYHIEIIPSFDSPAHMDYITWRYEQYANSTGFSFKYNGTTHTANSSQNYCINYTGMTAYKLGTDKDAGPTTWPCYTTIDITDGTVAKDFVFALYEDIADFFKKYAGSTNFSIGADEVNMTYSSGTYPRKWTTSQFPGYINDLNALLNGKGYTMRMYNDFMGSSSFTLSQFDSNIEIQYWDSPFNPNAGTKGTGKAASSFVSDGRTLYNCIQTNTYYVLRVANSSTATTKYTDARNPANRQWTFYHSTEDLIYNEWVPNNVSEKGDYSESVANIPTSQLGGAYFLIWNDYASVSTEAELWNGAPDTTGTNNGVTYYLLDRMASNIIKMWNWDINNSVTYSKFTTVRDTFGNFPGFTSCSASASLPDATAPVKATNVDKSALQAAVDAAPTAQGSYTADSWTAFQTALTAAKAVLNDADATQEAVDAALADLNAAVAALVSVDKSALQTAVNAAPSDASAYTAASWTAYQTALTAAKAVLNNANATQAEVNDALTDLNTAKAALVDISGLKSAVAGAITEQGSYTDDTWAAYEAALAAAETVLADSDATQAEVNDALAALAAAAADLEVVDGPEILNIRKLSKTATKGKKIGLVITTTTDAEAITITLNGVAVTPTLYKNNIQTLSGVESRVWMINFPATEIGVFDYVISITGGESETVTITVK